MDDTWQEIIKELAPERLCAGDKAPRPYQPFIAVSGKMYCVVPDVDYMHGCKGCDMRPSSLCNDVPDCRQFDGAYKEFTPEHYARLVAHQWRGNDAGNTPAESN